MQSHKLLNLEAGIPEVTIAQLTLRMILRYCRFCKGDWIQDVNDMRQEE